MSMRYIWHFLFCGSEAPGGVGTPFYGLYEELHPKGYLFCVKWYIMGLRNGPRGGALPVQNFFE